ncbi:MAG: C39 family peptidase, partial [Actinobacteria bacterium]|nr:C39 family peptidase [Actinomycetota bacterium]
MSECTIPETYDDGSFEPEPEYSTTDYTTISADLDGDGFAETSVIDFDADGVADAYDILDPETGAETLVIDVDGDGLVDTAVTDADGDGVFESGVADTDGDGEIDSEFDPNTGLPVDTTVPFEETGDDPITIDDTTTETDDDQVHGDPMAEIPYHQAQVGPNDCLPTSVAMVLTEVTGAEVPQGDLVDLANEMQLLGPEGMTLDGGVQLLEHYGVEAEVETGSMEDLRAMLDEGRPIIIGLDSDDLYGAGDSPFADDMVAGHAVVITGIDDEAGLVYINDPGFPDGAGVAIPIEQFEDAWTDADHTMIVADDPSV